MAEKHERKFLHTNEAAQYVGVSVATLRRWEGQGKLIPARRTLGGWRLYTREQLDQAWEALCEKR